ncbi:MAG: phage holin family protein, partial [Candidatus Cybelea sp.]
WLLNAISFAILTYWIAPFFHIGINADSVTALIVAALVFGIINAVIRPLATILSIPFIILTLGLFLFVLNALLLWLVGGVVAGFHVDGFWAAFWGAIWLGIISWVINAIGLRAALQKA